MLQLGLAEKARGELDSASAWLERACAADPDSAVARFYAGEVYYNRGLNDAALGALREAIARNPDYAEAHYLLAFVYGDMGQHEAARESTKRAIALNPTLAKAQANLALERFSEGGRREEAPPRRRPPESGAVSRRSIGPQSVPGAALAHFNLGLALRQKGYHQEALREYHLALEAGEDRRLNLQAMAEVHLLRRELGAALELYEGLIREYPGLAQAVERARRLPAPGGPAGRGDRLLRAGGRDRLRLPARLEQPRRRSGPRGEPRSRDGGVPAGARRRSAPPGGSSQSRTALRSSGGSSAPRSRSISRRSPSSPRARWPGTASGWCSWSSGATRTRATRSDARWTPTPASPPPTTTSASS